ncbi:MAG: peptidylglycine monooxygenase-like protein [Armatimonadaceae bacterium]
MKRRQVISRRELLGSAGVWSVGTAMGTAAGMGLFASRSEARPQVLVGSGEHTYRCTHDWLQPPPDLLWGDTHGVAQDAAGRIYVAHTVHPDSPKKDAIVVFDRNGKFLTSWGERFAGGAHGLDIRREGATEYLYHCDTRARLVVKTTLDGTVVWERGVPEEAGVYKDGGPYIPTNVAFGPVGELFVADGYGSNWIHQYDLNGNWVRTFGGTGTEPGKVRQPHGIWLDNRPSRTRSSEPLLVVADRANRRLQYFSLDGKPVGIAQEGMRQPCHFHLRQDLMLVPDLDSIVTLLDADNRVVAALGDGKPTALRGKPRSEFLPGKFIHPHSAKFLQDGSILVVEWVPIGRVTRLERVRSG